MATRLLVRCLLPRHPWPCCLPGRLVRLHSFPFSTTTEAVATADEANARRRHAVEVHVHRAHSRLQERPSSPDVGRQSSRSTHGVLSVEQQRLMTALRRSADALDWKGALCVLDSVPKDPDPTWLLILHSVLSVCCRAMRYDEACDIFYNRLPRHETHAFNMMINLCGRLQRHSEAQDFLKQMDASGVKRDAATYSSVLNQLAVASDWSQALQTLGELKSNAELSTIACWDAVYISAMSACARAAKPAPTRALFEELCTKQAPSAKHYNTMIVSCGADVAAAQAVLREMRAAGITPRIEEWTALMGHSCDFEETKRLYIEARAELPCDSGLEELWAKMLRCAVIAKDLANVKWTLSEMRKAGVDPNSEQALANPSLKRALVRAWVHIANAKREGASVAVQSGNKQRQELQEQQCKAPLPAGWSSATDPATGYDYYWQDRDPTGSTTWCKPSVPSMDM